MLGFIHDLALRSAREHPATGSLHSTERLPGGKVEFARDLGQELQLIEPHPEGRGLDGPRRWRRVIRNRDEFAGNGPGGRAARLGGRGCWSAGRRLRIRAWRRDNPRLRRARSHAGAENGGDRDRDRRLQRAIVFAPERGQRLPRPRHEECLRDDSLGSRRARK